MLYTCFGGVHFEFDPENQWSSVRLQDVEFLWPCGWRLKRSGTRRVHKVMNHWLNDTALCSCRSSSWLRFLVFNGFSQSLQANSVTSPQLDNCHFFQNYVVFPIYHPPITLPLTVWNLRYRVTENICIDPLRRIENFVVNLLRDYVERKPYQTWTHV